MEIGNASPPTRPATPIVRSDIWLEDGNVVLEAEKMQFKVHRGLLARNSNIFGDMFSVPQPPLPEEEMVEGCAVVHLSDSAKDVGFILKALLERGFATSRDPVPIDITAAFLSLGTKYDFDVLRAEALHRIFYEAPTTLEDCDKMTEGLQINVTGNSHRGKAFWLDILNLAREHNLRSVFPFALWNCCILVDSLGPAAISQGVERSDGSRATLSIQDQIRCLSSYHSLHSLQRTTTYAWLDAEFSYQSCEDPSDCFRIRSGVLRESFFTSSSLQGLDPFHKFSASNERLYLLCAQCDQNARAIHSVGRYQFWERLPEAFDLPPWHELRDERDQSLCA